MPIRRILRSDVTLPAIRTGEMFGRSKTWLLELANQHTGEQCSTDTLLKIILAVWICERASGLAKPSSDFQILIQTTSKKLREQHDFNPLLYDTKLLLLCQGIFSKWASRDQRIDAFSKQVAHELLMQPKIPLRYSGEALLLSKLGYHLAVPEYKLDEDGVGLKTFELITSDKKELIIVCNNVSAATHFGKEPHNIPAVTRRKILLVFPNVFIQSLREYDLETGAVLLRAMNHMAIPQSRDICSAIAFLAQQQRADGRFGYFSSEAAKICKGENSFNELTQLSLPITLSCLWALAEVLVPGFLLFHDPAAY